MFWSQMPHDIIFGIYFSDMLLLIYVQKKKNRFFDQLHNALPLMLTDRDDQACVTDHVTEF